MRARKITMAIAAGALLALPAVSTAQITGVCSDCHTMHNSKAGAPMAFTRGGTPSVTPNPVLLVSDCMGCHASGGPDAIATFGDPVTGSKVPQVYHTDRAKDLAGGNFAYIDGTKGGGANDRKGHNVVDILSADATLTGPPGMGRGATDTSMHTASAAVPNTTFTCAGNDGCHGIRNRLSAAANADGNGSLAVKLQGLGAMTGAHHYNLNGRIDSTTAPATPVPDDLGKGYRFILGLYGTEIGDWQNTDASHHNEYFGKAGSPFGTGCGDCHDPVNHGSATTAYMVVPSHSISGFCSGCHGTFHLDTTTNGFVRHPTDLVLPNKTEYAAYTTYNVTAPVARADLGAIAGASIVTPGGGNDVVACVSCHQAHGTDNPGMLRFNYAQMVAGGGANTDGCFACHTTKDTGTR